MVFARLNEYDDIYTQRVLNIGDRAYISKLG